jgi:Zn-finger nucleic acid-binding protein
MEEDRMDNPTKAGTLCPVCRVDLVMADRQGVEIDYCPQCRGVWLDRGELDKIVERSAQYEAPVQQPGFRPGRSAPDHYGDRDHGGTGKYGKKRKSFLKEIFDFD